MSVCLSSFLIIILPTGAHTNTLNSLKKQHNAPSALVAEAVELILPQHVSCQDPASKSQMQQFLESPDQLLIVKLLVANQVSSHAIGKIEKFIEEDTRYKRYYTQDNDASVFFKIGPLVPYTVFPGSLLLFETLQNPLLESPSAAPLYFLESH